VYLPHPVVKHGDVIVLYTGIPQFQPLFHNLNVRARVPPMSGAAEFLHGSFAFP
jgi:hypothetical protein